MILLTPRSGANLHGIERTDDQSQFELDCECERRRRRPRQAAVSAQRSPHGPGPAPNNTRVVIRPFEPTNEQRIERIIARIMSLSEPEVDFLLQDVMSEFHSRHQRTRQFFLYRFEQVNKHLLTDQPLSENRRLLIGAYFTQEYALESAALFNPSMVWHPDQAGLPEGWRRFLLSLRNRRRAHLVDHVPQRHDRRRQPHPDGRADAVCDRPRAGAQHAVR